MADTIEHCGLNAQIQRLAVGESTSKITRLSPGTYNREVISDAAAKLRNHADSAAQRAKKRVVDSEYTVESFQELTRAAAVIVGVAVTRLA